MRWNDSNSNLEAARAQLAVDPAQLARDRTNLNYSVIRSPISGVVIARNVDIGQTVAASFQTPTLFQIAKDLRQMQIDTSVAEADIGHLHLGQTVNFSVDAFQEREFTGTVKQVRLNPTIQQNVVSYNVIVAVPNDDGVLLPGMTANVRFTVNQKKAVLRVPNAALRYKPAEEDSDTGTTAPPEPGKHALYRLEDGKPVPVNVKTGISDNNFTEILEGEIKEGDKLIVREVGGEGKVRQQTQIQNVLMTSLQPNVFEIALIRVENLCKIYSLESGDKQGGGTVNSQVLFDVNLVDSSWRVRCHHGTFRFRQIHPDEYTRLSRYPYQRPLLARWTRHRVPLRR